MARCGVNRGCCFNTFGISSATNRFHAEGVRAFEEDLVLLVVPLVGREATPDEEEPRDSPQFGQ